MQEEEERGGSPVAGGSGAYPGPAALLLRLARLFAPGRSAIDRCRRAEAELRDCEQRFRLTVDEAPIGMALVSLSGRHQRVNKVLCETLGYEEQQLLSLRWQEITHPDDLEKDLALTQALVEGRIPRFELEKRFVSGSGATVLCLLGVSLVRDSRGAPWYFITRIEDITARRRLENQLRWRERKYRGIFDTSIDPIFIVDDDSRFVDLNPAALALVGMRRDDLIGSRIGVLRNRIVDFDIGAAWRRLQAEGTLKGEFRIRAASGEVRVLEFIARSQFVPGRSLAVLRDLTERHRASEERERLLAALSAKTRWLDTLIDRSPVAIFLVGEDGRMRVNRRVHDLLGEIPPGTAPEDLVGRMFDEGGTPVAPDRMPLMRALRGETVQAEEICFRRPDNRTVSAVVSAGAIRDEQGRQLGAVAVVEDITRLKELERLREEWTSVVAHDLRQPVTVINAQAQLLLRRVGGTNPIVEGKLAHIGTAARQLDRMIGDLLDVSRIESRRLTLARQPVDLESFALAVVERQAEELAGHPVVVQAVGEVPPIWADPVRVEQILTNLLSNAAKYGLQDGPIEIELRAAGESVLVRVSNRGRGIRPEEISGLFTRFHRTPSARTGSVGGLGLGLYITRGLVEAHGGTIFATSVPDGITSFSFSLPVARGSA